MNVLQVLVASICLFGASRAVAAETDPLQEGPFPVGVTTHVFVDSSRTDHFTQKPRTLVTEIWYPAADAARTRPKSKFTDFMPGGMTPELEALFEKRLGLKSDALNARYTMGSHRDAPVRDGKYPVIVFSHGNGGNRYQNTFWCDFVASHGYVIVSADHTGNAAITILKDGNVPYQGGERANSAADRPKDMSFLLDQMGKWNAGAEGADPRFKGRFDLARPCAAGMSFGSMTAVRVAETDPRFKSVIAMSGAYPENKNLKVPTLWMIGTEDRTIGPIGNSIVRAHHQKHEGPSYLLELNNGGHYSFTDMFKMNPNHGDGIGSGTRREGSAKFEFTSMEKTYQIINSYSVAFLSVYVKGDSKSAAYLASNHWPEDLLWNARNTGSSGQ
jgi:dienelactone hydrolase